MFEPFQKFMPRAANRYGIGNEVEAASICQIFRTILPDIFVHKESAAQNITPAYYKKNTIVINVKTPAWGQEVIMRKSKIIEEMNRRAGKKIIKTLRTQLNVPPVSS
ncbi:DUF721 domain-containing protein [Candidatus Peregrinibacteria bacterium]|nr:DUF721 domain-containing protein [Candidatus Peregrinibacteria bacterium]